MTSKLTKLMYLVGAVVLVGSIMMYGFGIGTLGRDVDKLFVVGGGGLGIMAIGYLFNENKIRIQEVDEEEDNRIKQGQDIKEQIIKLEERIDELGGIVVDEKYDSESNKSMEVIK